MSPARRAQQTAQALAEISHHKLRTLEELAPGATAAEVLAAADWPKSKAAIVVVGHQPTLGLVASELLSGQALDWSLKKGGLWWLSQRENNGDRANGIAGGDQSGFGLSVARYSGRSANVTPTRSQCVASSSSKY